MIRRESFDTFRHFPCSFFIWHSCFAIPNRSACNRAGLSHTSAEMPGMLFDIPSLRFLRRFSFFDIVMRTFASSLHRWLSARACDSREVISRFDEAEFPTASQSALFEWALDDWRAADGASLDALRQFNNWTKRKDQHELLFNWETLAPFARRLPTPWQQPCASSARRSEGPKKDILATDCRIFWKWRNEGRNNRAQWRAVFATSPQA
jgi:hypothetical protein